MSEVKCSNCGAEYNFTETKCPFCGYINTAGAEAKFMQGLGKTKNALGSVAEDIKHEHANEKQKWVRHVLKIVILVFIVLLLLFGIANYVEHNSYANQDKDNYTEELVWQHKRFEEYDKMFENKEYESLLEAIANDLEKHEVYNWEHYEEFARIADELWGEK